MNIFTSTPDLENSITQSKTNLDSLRSQLNIASSKKAYYQKLNRAVPLSGIFIFLLMMISYSLWDSKIMLAIGLFYLIVALISPLFPLGNSIIEEVEALENEIGLEASGAEAIELRAERLFKNHEIDLKKYYRQTLTQSNIIFLAGLICILLGFAIIGGTYYFVWITDRVPDQDAKIIASVFGFISGVMVNFVAVIYIKMFAETTKSLTTFHEKLVTTHHLHFANYLVTKISDTGKREDTISTLATNLSK